MQDPKQFLLMHVEKFVLVVMGLLLVAVLFLYAPWDIEVKQKSQIRDRLQDGLREMNDTKFPPIFVVEQYTEKINELYQTPWLTQRAPALLQPNWPIFWNLPRKGVWKERAPEAPAVVGVKAVYAKADRGQAVIVFQIDDMAERRLLGDTAIQDYQNGLEFERIEIYRVDRGANEKPVRITPDNWKPEGLPARYGAPLGSSEVGAAGDVFDVPVYIYAQARPPMPPGPYGGGMTPEERQRLEDQRRRMEEEMRRRIEEDRRREEERRRGKIDTTKPTPTPSPTPRRPTTTTPTPTPVPRPGPVRPVRTTPETATKAPGGWYYFVDQNVDPDGRYEYNVVIVCRNPVYQQYKDTREGVREFVSSEPVSTPPSAVIRVESYKRWYFQGGTHSDQVELGTFKVRNFVGGRRDFTPEEIAAIVAELSGTADTSKTSKSRTAVKTTEPEGLWVEAGFTVRPGEEIGGKTMVNVGGEKREVDFSTGCYVVSVRNDVQVTEDARPMSVAGPDGTLKTETRINRMVIPKLRLAYMDKKGALRTKWQEVPPALPRGKDEK